MAEPEADPDVLKRLRDEIAAVQGRRHTIILRKLSFAVALLGLGSVSLPEAQFADILYLVPLVALVFDVYILVEDYRIKRIAEFLRQHAPTSAAIEKRWEDWVRCHPNRLAPFAAPLVTQIMLFGAALVLWPAAKHEGLYWLWLLIITAVNAFLAFRSRGTRSRFHRKERTNS